MAENAPPPQKSADRHHEYTAADSGEQPANGPFTIVGVGASAGGLEAFTQLLSALPDNTGMAFVLVQHLDPKHQSSLSELLAKVTRMPVVEAAQGLAVRPDHIYVIQPNTTLTIAQGYCNSRREARRAAARTWRSIGSSSHWPRTARRERSA